MFIQTKPKYVSYPLNTIVRGGSYMSEAYRTRINIRGAVNSINIYDFVGFRIVLRRK